MTNESTIGFNWVPVRSGWNVDGLDFDVMKKLIDDHGKVLDDSVSEEKGDDV